MLSIENKMATSYLQQRGELSTAKRRAIYSRKESFLQQRGELSTTEGRAIYSR